MEKLRPRNKRTVAELCSPPILPKGRPLAPNIMLACAIQIDSIGLLCGSLREALELLECEHKRMRVDCVKGKCERESERVR